MEDAPGERVCDALEICFHSAGGPEAQHLIRFVHLAREARAAHAVSG